MSARFAAVLADLRKEYAKIGEAIAVLERLDGDAVAEPTPIQRRGGARKAVAKAASTKPAAIGGRHIVSADDIKSHGRARSPYPIKGECVNGHEFTRTGPRSKCPECAS